MIKNFLISNALTLIMSFLGKEQIKGFVDKVCNFLENKVLGSASKIDDKFILPLMENLRDALDVQDKDGTFAAVPTPSNALAAHAVSSLTSFFTPDLIRDFLDDIFDFLENAVLGSASDIDDRFVLPAIKTLRVALDIPDGDD